MTKDQWLRKGVEAHDKKDYVEAVRCYGESLNRDFNDYQALHFMGLAFMHQGHHGLGATLMKASLAIKKDQSEVYSNLSICYKKEFNLEIAEKLLLESVKLKPETEAYTNLSSINVNTGTPEKAIEYADKALELDPHNSDAIRNKSFALLELERWAEGWDIHDTRLNKDGGNDRQFTREGPTPWWDGSHGKTVVVYGEQGIGDEMMYASMIPDLQKVCKEVIFECHPRLIKTFERSFPGMKIYGTRKDVAIYWPGDHKIDAKIPIGSLGKFFRRSAKDFPGKPFLKADNSKAPMTGGRMKIGISWAGGIKETWKDKRSIPLDLFAPLLQEDADYYSLQYTDSAPREVCVLEEKTGVRIRHYPGYVQCHDYDITAAFVNQMDVVISVCTTAVHMAGALGVPCYCLVPNTPAWRYGLKRDRMIWYNSVELFRQKDSWEEVIERVRKRIQRDNSRIQRVKSAAS